MNGERKVKLSRWVKIFKRDNVLALYHTLNLAVIYFSQKHDNFLYRLSMKPENEQSVIGQIGENCYVTLIGEKMIVPTGVDDMKFLFTLREELVEKISLSMMYLLVTDNCNLKCSYCFEDAAKISGEYKPQMMTKEFAEKSIDYFAFLLRRYGRSDKKKIVHLYGGEPMLNPEAVKTAVNRIISLKENGGLPANCDIAIVTNGTLLNEEFAQFFSENNVTVGLSLDGPERITNKYRLPKISNVNVFTKVVRSYETLIKYKVKTGFSVTLTPESLDCFEELVDYFVNKIGVQDGMCFNILHYSPTANVSKEYFNRAAQCLIKAYSLLREKKIYEERMMRKAKAFAYREPMLADCSVIGGQIVIAPDGKVGVCQDFVKPRTYFGKTVDSDYDPFESGLFENWKRRSPFFMEKCFDCEALGICGGGCPAGAELETGSRWNIDERICPHSKLTLEWLIWDTYSHLKKETKR